jgi:hypothetical protein
MFHSIKYLMGSLIAALFVAYNVEYAPLTENYGLKSDRTDSRQEMQAEEQEDDNASTCEMQSSDAVDPVVVDTVLSFTDPSASGSIPF